MIYRVERNFSTFVHNANRQRACSLHYSFNEAGGLVRTPKKRSNGLSTSIGPYNWRRNDCQEILDWELRYNIKKFQHLGGYEDKRHPTVYEDFRLASKLRVLHADYSDYEFGFESLAKLFKWFDDVDRITLQRCGFYIAIYETNPEDTIHGSTQSLFKLSKATLVDCEFFEYAEYNLEYIIDKYDLGDLSGPRVEYAIADYNKVK
ncbi:hypothetical protein NCTGTJJY_CDS0004 [Serratia phage 92A1]|nr:hypothetical protein NCTGTJJY_CDS0004 [Serratia phage 92A1]